MEDTNFDQEQAHYHFTLGEIVYYISQYGIDSVMTDIYDYLEVEKQKRENCNGFCGEYECKENQSVCKRKAQEK